MAKPLRIFTDGSYNERYHIIGWGYVIVDGDTVLYADSGVATRPKGGANMGEHLAVIHALLALQTTTTALMMIDADSVVDLVNGQKFKRERPQSIGKFRNIIRRLCATHNISAKSIKSGKHPYNRYADTLARRACGLPPKSSRCQRKNRKRRLQYQLDRENETQRTQS